MPSDISADDFQKAVEDERRYELAGEGIRWHDLVRWNKYVETLQNMFISDDDTAEKSYTALAKRVTKDSISILYRSSRYKSGKDSTSRTPDINQ